MKASGWRFLFSPSFVLLLPSLISLALYPCCKFTFANDTLRPGQLLNGGQILQSKNGAFNFKLGYNSSACCFGIWFTNSSSCTHFPVWQIESALPTCFDFTSYSLSVSEDGVLSLTYGGNTPVWWTSPSMNTTSISAVAVLLDNGNLVIRDQVNSSIVVWQSFDNPISVLLPGGYLGFNPITGQNVTLASQPSFYDWVWSSWYTLAFDATRRRGFIIQQDIGVGASIFGTFPRWMDIHEDGGYALTFKDAGTYIHLNSSGFVTFAKQWECDTVLWSAPDNLCEYDSYCGPDSVCIIPGSCLCPVGFYPLDFDPQNASGCTRNASLNCTGSDTLPEAVFYPKDGIHRYPDNALILQVVNMSECQYSCLMNCCTAFAYNTSCMLWFSELWNTVVLGSGSNGNRIYIRLATEQPQPSFPKKAFLVSVIAVLALIAIGLILLWRCRRNSFKARTVNDSGSLMVFSFVQIKNSTKNFSEKLGEGGFGYVFKGVLPGRTFVAVKKLKGLRQEEKQFRAEVQTIGLIQHINIVRLLGFCAQDSKRFLVYEYMANGSLNSHLFSKSSSKLGWEVRYSIALGLARGLAYLHEECKDCIVHCDMKPDNVLLDEQFCPKIADFGMAKLLGRDFSRVLTTMRGTIGYLAPEWISGVPITYKADVYSYGMVLLEIISGRRNSEKIKEGSFTYFPIYAAVKVNKGDDVMCLLDSSLEGNADAEQLTRACRVACWCIQGAEDHRPMMGHVVRMLEGVMDVGVPPVPRSLQTYAGMEDSTSAEFCISKASCTR
ncbi:hypothetical protein U9M48_021261 [Paspalum notatum var. saurae]|uniref:Receptor-like serine/threonine-protein kinase n=1 Tax=Paspalum notatum var. saurae TaxID=547442 RepID=A0AAQ3WSJ7_PASNO